jgi:hypothetical protein
MNDDSLPIDFEVDARPRPFPEPAPVPVSWWRRLWERIAGRTEDEQ